MSVPPFDFDSYSELSLQRLMVLDRPRTDAFAEAIREVVQLGSRVIDVGAGTGLLSMLAARAGATTVLGLERSSMAEIAEQVVRKNELSEQVAILREDASTFQSESPVDLVVSEWLGHLAFTEGMLPHVLACRDNNLASSGVMLPSAVELLLAPVHSDRLYNKGGPGAWDRTIQGIDFSCLEGMEVEQAVGLKTTVEPSDLMAPGQKIVVLDLKRASVDDIWQSGELRFVAGQDGPLHGFAGWFDTKLSPSVCLSTAPDAPETHWQQTYLAVKPMALKKGEEFTVRYGLYEHPIMESALELELVLGDDRYLFTVT